jgi:viroplasmin and RNaseH domain-containing protein
MAKNKFYGVRVGHKVGVFNCWSDCSKSVTGYSGAEYKGAPTYEEAYEFVYGAKPEVIEASRSTFNSEEDDFESESDVVSIYTCGIQSPDSTSSAYGYVMNIGKTTLKNMSKLITAHMMQQQLSCLQ